MCKFGFSDVDMLCEVKEMRYERQVLMKQIGENGQKMIEAAKVVVIGAGGLGSQVLYHLAAAGVGEMTIIDSDVVELSNLNRQVIHWEKNIGQPKVLSAREKLQAFNSTIKIKVYNTRIDEENARELLSGNQVIVDCVDNVETRMLVNRWGMLLNIPIVEGGVQGMFGFVMNVRQTKPCLQCAWGEATSIPGPKPVVGAVAGIMGSLQALHCLKIITRNDQNCYSKLWVFDFDTLHLDAIDVQQAQDCPACSFVNQWHCQV